MAYTRTARSGDGRDREEGPLSGTVDSLRRWSRFGLDGPVEPDEESEADRSVEERSRHARRPDRDAGAAI